MKKFIDLAECVYSAMFLIIGIVLGGALLATYLLTVGVLVGAPAGLIGSPYWYNCWIAFDRFANAVLKGDPLETISSRLGKSIYHRHSPVFGWYRFDRTVSWWLSQVDKDHCRKSIDWEVGKGR